MRATARAGIAGFAFANLFLLSLTGPLVSPQHELVFHLPGSAEALFFPVLLDLLIVWAVLWFALWAAQRHPRLELLVWSALLLVLPSSLLATGFGFSDKPVPSWLGWSVAVAALLVFAGVNLGWRRMLPRFARVQPGVGLGLSFLALPELLLCLQLVWYAWEARDLNPPFQPVPAPAAASLAPGAQPVRVLWIILDELAYDQVYGRRYPGLALPNFDRLAGEATVFTQAVPTAEYTRQALPSMLTGQPVRRTRPSASGQKLTLLNGATGHRFLFDPQDTVFGDARRDGLATAVAGWYEPYCRLLEGMLDRCFWTYSDDLPGGLTTGGNLATRTVAPFLHLITLGAHAVGLQRETPGNGRLDLRRHRADYEALLAASDGLLRPAQPGLVLLHMPIPHPWGFYDRHTGAFSKHRTSYLDNLVLADAFLGRVRAELEAQGVWDGTNVLVMGDHSWRTSEVWSNSGHWTAEEQAASHGGAFDDRPAVILKLAGEHSGGRLDGRFETLRTRALLDQMLTGGLPTPDALERWVAEGTRAAGASPAGEGARRP